MAPIDKQQEEVLLKLLNDFPTYLAYVYKHIQLPNPTPLQLRIATLLTENPDRLILEAARGVGKSWISAIYTTWRLLRNIDEKIIIVSASSPKAIEISQFVRKLFIDVPILQHLDPSKSQRDSVLSFDVAGCKTAIAPSVSINGIGGQLTGKRASLVLADDIEVPNNSMTEMMREKLVERCKEFESLLMPDMPSSIIFLGTPQSMESVYNKLPYRTVVLPAIVPEDESVYEGKLDDWIMLQGKAGEATDKVRFPDEVLLEKKSFMGESTFKLQFMLDTTLSDSDRYPLKLKDLIVTDLDKDIAPKKITHSNSREHYINDIPNIGFTGDRLQRPSYVHNEYTEYDTKIMAIDPSGSGSDETAWAIIGVLNGFIYVLDVDGTKEGYSEEALTTLATKAKEFKVNTIVLEKNFGSGMFTVLLEQMISKIYPCTLDEVTAKGQKEVRIINSLEPLTTNHKLVIDYSLVERDINKALEAGDSKVYSLLYQYTRLTKDRQALVHDDRLDALAEACEYVKNMVLVDVNNVLEEVKKREMEQFLIEKVYSKHTPKKINLLNTV